MKKIKVAFLSKLADFYNLLKAKKSNYRALPSKMLKKGKLILRRPLFWSFLLPFLLMLCVFIAIGVFPFGKNSVLVLDLNGQYVYFFEALRSFIYGEASLLYSFSRALGGEFLGIYAYYLASPLSYIVALFPKHCITEALFSIILIKIGLCGLTFGIMLQKKAKARPITTIIFSCVYALSGYVVIMQHNTMWMDNVFMLPLIVLGVDALISEGKYKLFVFSLVFAIMSNYYIGYMTCIFTFLYFFFSYFSRSPIERNPRNLKFHFFRSFFSVGFFAIISLAISAIIILPAYYSLTFGKTTFSDPTFEFVSKFDLLDLYSKFMFGSYDTVRPEGLPNVYCGIVTLFLVPVYYFNDRVNMREKICTIFLSLILIFSFSINTLDLVWHGFQAPNWLNYRYSYMLTFIMVYMAARGYENIRNANKKLIFFTASVMLLFLLFSSELKYEHVHPLLTVLTSIVCILVYYFAFDFIISKRKLSFKLLSGFLLAVVSLEMFLGGLYNTCSLDYDVVISNRESYLGYMDKWEDAMAYIKKTEKEPFYRVEKTDYRKVNDSYTLGYRGLSGSTSTLNADTVDFISLFGHNSASHSSQYTGSTVMADSLLSIKYVMAENDVKISQLYEKTYSDDKVSVYKNPYALPIAFGVSSDVNMIVFKEISEENEEEAHSDKREYFDSDSPFERLNRLTTALLGEDEMVKLYKQIDAEIVKENCKESTSRTKFYPIDEEKDSYLKFVFEGVGDKEIYAYFPTFYYTGAEMYLNGEKIGNLFKKDNHGYVYVGKYEENEKAELSFKLTSDGIYMMRHTKYFYYLDKQILDKVYEKLSLSAFSVEICEEDYFKGTITVNEGQNVILTTIPYDSGWRVTANGQKIDTYETLDALLAFDLECGAYELEFRYMPQIYIIGFYISLCGVALLTAVILTEVLLKRKSKQKNINP